MPQIAVFLLDRCRFGVALEAVEHVVRAVAVTPLPQAPFFVLGIINVRGRIVPVISLRRRFGMCDRAVVPEDQFLVAHTRTRMVALVVDAVEGVAEYGDPQWTPSEAIAPAAPYLRGVAKVGPEMTLVQDLDDFLSFDEEQHLAQTLLEFPAPQESHERSD